jgi:hypothetical protein
VAVELLQEHDLAEGALRVFFFCRGGRRRGLERGEDGVGFFFSDGARAVSGVGGVFGATAAARALRPRPAAKDISPSLTCASVAFWKASKIFFRATTFWFFLSMAFHTTPYACGCVCFFGRGRRGNGDGDG